MPVLTSRMMTAHDVDVVPAIGSRSLRVSGGGWQSHLARGAGWWKLTAKMRSVSRRSHLARGPGGRGRRVLTSILIVRTPGGCP